jgi:hypothetical protein
VCYYLDEKKTPFPNTKALRNSSTGPLQMSKNLLPTRSGAVEFDSTVKEAARLVAYSTDMSQLICSGNKLVSADVLEV